MERNVSFQKGVEKYAYVLQTDLYNKLAAGKVIKEAAIRSGLQEGLLNAAWLAIGSVIVAWATEGHSVAIPGLGTMRFGVNAQSVADVNEVSASLITARKVIFTPSVDIKKELAATKINITCYDRNGDLVKQVTSTDDAEVEDNNSDADAVNGGSTENGGGSDNNGGGSDNNGGGSDDNDEVSLG